ncbi:MAG: hypothetical protein QOE90_3678 [Thermoplasmata archaeon]|jgi:hypothetical protein|nr:hypothetical protein [Thermoplasmata archaeon]
MKLVLVFALVALAFAPVLVAPAAEAGPQCIEVYPWSDLCHGDVSGFLCDEHVACLETGP